jgi:hypothetical protein
MGADQACVKYLDFPMHVKTIPLIWGWYTYRMSNRLVNAASVKCDRFLIIEVLALSRSLGAIILVQTKKFLAR